MGWNEGPSRNFSSSCFGEFQRNGEIGRAFSRASGWKSAVPEPEKKRFHPRGINIIIIIKISLVQSGPLNVAQKLWVNSSTRSVLDP